MTSASATRTAPPWEPDPNAEAPYGTLAFYNSAGTMVTSGTNLNQLFSYVEGSTKLAPTPLEGTAYKSTLYFSAPNHSLPTGQWFTSEESGSVQDPDSTAPGALATSADPVLASNVAGNADLLAFIGNATLDSTAGYADIIQVRLLTTEVRSDAGSAPDYWDGDVAYNTGKSSITVDGETVAAGGWAQVYPIPPTATTTKLASSKNPATTGTKVTYTATVTPNAKAGTVKFVSGSTAISGCKAVKIGASTGKATCSVTYSKAGTFKIKAVYSGTSGYASSTSAVLTETVKS
jgi:hypothetical protein